MTTTYPFKQTEETWQRRWEETGAFKADNASDKPPCYVLEMFPYPSGHIHMGHLRNYVLGDVLARFRRAQGYEVLHPMGWDAFGLPAENAAIERDVHPAEWTHKNIAQMREQLRGIGLSYDWSRELATCSPDYYRHEQAFFLALHRRGLAYRKTSTVNWDPVDHTVLANEQVVEGRGWRSGALIERRELTQWFLRITDYAQELLDETDRLEGWPDRVRQMQKRWIGRSEGLRLRFAIEGFGEELEIFTTRPDTYFGASFIAIAPDHPLARKLAAENPDAAAFIAECDRLGTAEEAIEKADKKGFDTGWRIRRPLDEAHPLPVYIANFVLMGYGTGAIYGCPAHDPRDLEFARAYGLPVTPVVCPDSVEPQDFTVDTEAYTGEGRIINSGFLDGLTVVEAKEEMAARAESGGWGAREVNFRLRDWGVSRQRYWGCPIPMIHCPECGVVPVPEDQLPVTLPEDISFDKPGNPLDRHPTWKHVPCPECGGEAERETDTFDTFFESSWYFVRYCTPHATAITEKPLADRWLPVDYYIGGIEHAVLHLLYARFFTKLLRDEGYISAGEPFKNLLTQGMVCHETYRDADGRWLYPHEVRKTADGTWEHAETGAPITVGRSEKMSKSKRNTVDPAGIIEAYGADTARLFMLSDSPPERDLEWSDAGIEGAWRYVSRIWRLLPEKMPAADIAQQDTLTKAEGEALELRRRTHRTIAQVTEDLERLHFNKAVARLRELSNHIAEFQDNSPAGAAALAEACHSYLLLLSPFMPHLTAELGDKLETDGALADISWPEADKNLLTEDTVTLAVQVNGKLRGQLDATPDAPRELLEEQAQAQVSSYLEGKQIRKIIVVPGRIVNIVAA